MTKTLSASEDLLREAVNALDFAAIERAFRDQDEFVFIERFLPERLVLDLAEEARGFATAGRVHRAYVPWTRKAGAVGQEDITRSAPLLASLSRSPSLLDFARRLSRVSLEYKNPRDAHAAALYYYQRAGDHVSWHLDECGCETNASYTANFGITNDTKSRVIYRLPGEPPSGAPRELALPMVPGSLAFFCGSKPYHCVEPIGPGEDRIAFSVTFRREGVRLKRGKRFFLNAWDSLAYFGPRALFQKNYDT
jgi:hypothetical protein